MKYVNIEPYWPNMLKFFEQMARENRGTEKGRRFQKQADEIRRYIESTK